MKYSIIIDPSSSDDEIRQATVDVINAASKADTDIDAIAVFVYFNKKDVGRNPALAHAEWGPNGNIGDVTQGIATSNNRSSYKITYSSSSELSYQRHSLLKPTARERELHVAMSNQLNHKKYTTKVEVASAARALAPKLKVTELTLVDAFEHVGVYDIEHRK